MLKTLVPLIRIKDVITELMILMCLLALGHLSCLQMKKMYTINVRQGIQLSILSIDTIRHMLSINEIPSFAVSCSFSSDSSTIDVEICLRLVSGDDFGVESVTLTTGVVSLEM